MAINFTFPEPHQLVMVYGVRNLVVVGPRVVREVIGDSELLKPNGEDVDVLPEIISKALNRDIGDIRTSELSGTFEGIGIKIARRQFQRIPLSQSPEDIAEILKGHCTAYFCQKAIEPRWGFIDGSPYTRYSNILGVKFREQDVKEDQRHFNGH